MLFSLAAAMKTFLGEIGNAITRLALSIFCVKMHGLSDIKSSCVAREKSKTDHFILNILPPTIRSFINLQIIGTPKFSIKPGKYLLVHSTKSGGSPILASSLYSLVDSIKIFCKISEE